MKTTSKVGHGRGAHARVACVVLLAAIACDGTGDGGARRFRSIGTAGTGGIYYPLGGALADMLGEADPGTTYTAEVTGGSVENLLRVASGEIDLGIAIGSTLASAVGGPDAERYRRIRIVAPLYPNVTHVLVGGSSGIATTHDMRDARVSIGAPGSGTEQHALDVLAAHQITVDDLDARHLSFTESVSALRDGSIDAAIFTVGYPAAAVLEATTSAGVRLLPVAPKPLADLVGAHPYYEATNLPAGSYPGLDASVATIAVMNWVFANEDLPADVVTALLEILRERRARLVQVNEIAAQIDLTALDRAPVPLHSAAAEFAAEE